MASGPHQRAARLNTGSWASKIDGRPVLPTFMVSAALAGPLAHIVGALRAAASTCSVIPPSASRRYCRRRVRWGCGSAPGYVRSWRATANGLEGAAASATDTCLVLYELSVGEARDVAASVYALANGVGKSRATRGPVLSAGAEGVACVRPFKR